jgi:peptidoglycan/LPS O-acetylase OafA/YrhL
VPALDGIRALAVAAVLLFHGGVSWARGGFLGVDAFFVLSGYLITTLLLAERRRTGRISLARFWGRRARRLLPALLLMVVVVAIWADTFLASEEVHLLRGDALAAVFYVANWRMMSSGGDYFAQTAAPSPLQHTWSLGIEEQFYLAWPVLLLVVFLLRQPQRWLVAVCAGGTAASAVALALVYDAANPARAYYGTDTRGASLLMGAGVAAVLARRGQRAEHIEPHPHRSGLAAAAVLGAGISAWAWTRMSGETTSLYYGGMSVCALAVAAVIVHIALVPEGLSARLLSMPPLPVLGRISYGIYLWHWPVFLAADSRRTGQHGAALFALRCLITLAIACLSYLLVERPIRSGELLRRRPVSVVAPLATVAAAVAVILTVTATPPAPQPDVMALTGDGIDRVSGPESVSSGGTNTSPASSPPEPGRRHEAGEPVIVDVFGDSIAWSLVAYLPRHPGLDVRDRTSLGCGVATTAPYRYFGRTYPKINAKCLAWSSQWGRAVERDRPHVALILVGRWETMDRVFDGRWTHVGDPEFDTYLRGELEKAIQVAGAGGARVVLATEPYNRRGEQLNGSLFPEDQPQRVTDWNRLLRDTAAAHPGVRVVDFGARVSPLGRFTSSAGGVRVRSDGVHLTPTGVKTWIAPWLLPQLSEAARS